MNKYQQTIETFNAVADKYWDKFKDFQLYQTTYDRFIKQLPEGKVDLLEIACGPGNVSRYLLNQKPNINLLGIDLASNMVKLAQQHNQQAEYRVLDCRSITSLDQSFDAIMCGFCMPYLSWQDSLMLIQDMYQLMKPKGLIYISTTEGKKNNEGYQRSNTAAGAIYVHYHDIKQIQLQLEQMGLDILDIHKLNHIHNQEPTVDVFIMARKP